PSPPGPPPSGSPPPGATPPGATPLGPPPPAAPPPGATPPGPMPSGPPPPPPGPGVMPPFVAPPRDGATRRRTVAWVLAGVAVLVVCAGGLVGLGGLAVFGTQMIIDQSRAAVTDHLTAVQNGDYQAAYEALCEAERARVSASEFRRSQEARG